MPRNLDRRVEVLFPVTSPPLVRRLRGILNQYLADDATARHMRADGSYTAKPRDGNFNSQAHFLPRRVTQEADRVVSNIGKLTARLRVV